MTWASCSQSSWSFSPSSWSLFSATSASPTEPGWVAAPVGSTVIQLCFFSRCVPDRLYPILRILSTSRQCRLSTGWRQKPTAPRTVRGHSATGGPGARPAAPTPARSVLSAWRSSRMDRCVRKCAASAGVAALLLVYLQMSACFRSIPAS